MLVIEKIAFEYGKHSFFTFPIADLLWNHDVVQTFVLKTKAGNIGGPLKKYIKDNFINIKVSIKPFYNTETNVVYVESLEVAFISIDGGSRKPAMKKAMKIIKRMRCVGYSLAKYT